ncbi:BatD family protein [Amaricoccus sp.]|uniref:BatD family protein n=1 Tax=Amaricoccus sp. TaxID=1872485 RepID=UPI001B3E572A|nr:BatD family protein [Amaricoccus sp.]MBP7002187.1 BatD family protein [Amaricoccus sp.]
MIPVAKASIRLMAVAALLVLAGAASAQAPTPRVEIALTPEAPVTVGTPLTLAVTVLVPTFMPDPPVWPDFQIADAITRLPPDASRSLSQRIDGQTWAGVRRAYEIIPQRAADFALPPAEITVTYADPETNAPTTVQVPVPEIAFSATVPAGAEALDPFVAAASLTLTATAEGLPEAPHPGDALTLTLTVTATGAEAMLLPPLAAGIPTPAILRAYPGEPALADTPGQRGGPATATRTETVTYVVEAPGAATLPAVTLAWWNTTTGKVETATTDPVQITVAAPPGWQPPGTVAAPPRWPLVAVALVLVLAAIGPGLARRARRLLAEHARSEPVAYRRLTRVLRAGDAAALRPALADWRAAAGSHGPLPPDLEAALTRIERHRYGPAPSSRPDPAPALRALAAMRRDARPAGRRHDDLPPLNPPPLSERNGPRASLPA